MDYIDYELRKYYASLKLADDMEKAGFEDYEEYLEYLWRMNDRNY